MQRPNQTFPNNIVAETLPFFFARTIVWVINATKYTTEYPTAVAMFVSLGDLVARQTVT